MSNPISVLISDIHFNIITLNIAAAALTQAVNKANSLGLQLVVCGDIHDHKANLRGECVKVIMDILEKCDKNPIVIVANHDRINEKSKEHSLEFLRNTAILVNNPIFWKDLNTYLLPYYSDVEELRAYLKTLPKGARLIMHQGLNGSNAGEYILDKSALNPEDTEDFRVISGHYHERQDIKCGRPRQGAVGLFSYIGNPFSLGFGEANHPPKGYQILMDDGTLEFVPTNLRQHHIYEIKVEELGKRPTVAYNHDDLLWVKVIGTKEQFLNITKDMIARDLALEIPFRLDLIPLDNNTQSENATQNMTQDNVLDSLIDSISNTSDERKARLKELWRKAVCN